MGWAYSKQLFLKNQTFVSPPFQLKFKQRPAKSVHLTQNVAAQSQQQELEAALLKRTKELEEIQLAHTLELQRFAEFGRLSANLIHEIANPLTAASLSLEAIGDFDNPFIKRAQQNLRHLERYMQAARQQLQAKGEVVDFSIQHEIERIRLVINPLAQAAHIIVVYDIERSIMLRGDPIKFNQIIANLVVNAIDAYDSVTTVGQHKRIIVEAQQQSSSIVLCVRDWGCGIQDDQLEHIFEPFYTTKLRQSNRGLGIGLAMVKQITEMDFQGTICAASSP